MPLTPKSIMSTGPPLPFQRQKEVLASGKPQMSTMPLSSSLASKPLQPTQSGLTGSRTVILNFLTYGMQRTLSMLLHWKKIRHLAHHIHQGSSRIFGNGEKINLWHDSWTEGKPLSVCFLLQHFPLDPRLSSLYQSES